MQSLQIHLWQLLHVIASSLRVWQELQVTGSLSAGRRGTPPSRAPSPPPAPGGGVRTAMMLRCREGRREKKGDVPKTYFSPPLPILEYVFSSFPSLVSAPFLEAK